jgi:hypothetical protein
MGQIGGRLKMSMTDARAHLPVAVLPLVDAEEVVVELVEVHVHKSHQWLLLFQRLTPSTSLILGISSCHFRQ